jgi:hypothetical protein
MKRWFGDIPSLQPLCDEEGFVVCAEPPGGLIDNIADLDFLREAPPNAIVRRTALREIREEFGHLPRRQIRSLRVRRFPLATLGIAKASAFQAFVDEHTPTFLRAPADGTHSSCARPPGALLFLNIV